MHNKFNEDFTYWICRFYRHSSCPALIEQGYEVVSIDNINNYYDVQLKYVRLRELTSIEESYEIHGVTIGNNVIIGTGFVVTKNILDGCMVANNPIKYIIKTEEWYNKLKEIDLKSGQMNKKEKKKLLLSLFDNAFVHKPFIKTDK